jgi:hypothetical protein
MLGQTSEMPTKIGIGLTDSSWNLITKQVLCRHDVQSSVFFAQSTPIGQSSTTKEMGLN